LAFLEKLLDTPEPSGFETAESWIWRSEAKGFAQEVSADVKDNSQAAVNPGGSPRMMLAGHIDEIGLMIVHIDDDGFFFFSTTWISEFDVSDLYEMTDVLPSHKSGDTVTIRVRRDGEVLELLATLGKHGA